MRIQFDVTREEYNALINAIYTRKAKILDAKESGIVPVRYERELKNLNSALAKILDLRRMKKES